MEDITTEVCVATNSWLKLYTVGWQNFLHCTTENNASDYTSLICQLQTAFPKQDYKDKVDGASFKAMMESYFNFVVRKRKANATFAFWCTYMDMVEAVLQFIRSSREGNWPLHLASVRAMVPWMFSYDRYNYARYLPVYWMETNILPKSHPFVYEHFQKGYFSVQRQDSYGFAGIPCDMTIEQTVNKDSKTRGGLKGFTVNKGAVNR